jgi:hypothetical protein
VAEEEQKVDWKGPKIFLGVMAAIVLGPIVLVTVIVGMSPNIEKQIKECTIECLRTHSRIMGGPGSYSRCEAACEKKLGD